MADQMKLHRLKKVKLSPLNLQALTDADGSGVADALEKPLKQAKPITYGMLKSKKKHHFWKAVRATLAGETTVGVIGAELKNILKRFIPFGEPIDRLTDWAGEQFKSNQTYDTMKNPTVSKPSPQPSTIKGVAILVSLLALAGVHLDAVAVSSAVSGIITGLSLAIPAVISLWEMIRDEVL